MDTRQNRRYDGRTDLPERESGQRATGPSRRRASLSLARGERSNHTDAVCVVIVEIENQYKAEQRRSYRTNRHGENRWYGNLVFSLHRCNGFVIHQTAEGFIGVNGLNGRPSVTSAADA